MNKFLEGLLIGNIIGSTNSYDCDREYPDDCLIKNPPMRGLGKVWINVTEVGKREYVVTLSRRKDKNARETVMCFDAPETRMMLEFIKTSYGEIGKTTVKMNL